MSDETIGERLNYFYSYADCCFYAISDVYDLNYWMWGRLDSLEWLLNRGESYFYYDFSLSTV